MDSLQHVQLYGILNAIKTGDPVVDAVGSIVLPLLLTSALGWLGLSPSSSGKSKLLSFDVDNTFLVRWLRGNAYTRKITYRCYQHSNSTMTNLDSDSHNEYLVRAIKLYVHQKCKLDLADEEVDLSDIGKRNVEGTYYSSTKIMLSYCELIKKPVQNIWNRIGVFDGSPVWMRISDTTNADDKTGGRGTSSSEQKIRTVVVNLASSRKSSVDTLIKDALNWYKDQLANQVNKHRYFFDVASFAAGLPLYNTYQLSGEKTVDTIFSQPAKELIKIVDDFQAKKGKYGVTGFPYKLGILLHGPPGTVSSKVGFLPCSSAQKKEKLTSSTLVDFSCTGLGNYCFLLLLKKQRERQV